MVIPSSDSDFEALMASQSKIVVKYYADWCGTCKLFAPKFRRLSEDERYKDIAFIEVNAETSPNARKIAGVTNLPYMAIFKDGHLVESAATGKEEAVVEMLAKL